MKKLMLVLICFLCLLVFASCATTPKDPSETTEPGAADGTVAQEDTDPPPQPEHVHIYTATVVAPTCEEDGYTLYHCFACGAQYSDQVISALGHTYSEKLQNANCNQYQKKVFTCVVCKHSYDETLETKGTKHSYVATVTYPDRENQGYTTHQCKNCTESYVDSYTDPVDFSTGLVYTQQAGQYYVTGLGTCTDTDIIIPSKSEQGYRVAGIAANAFADSAVRSITVSPGVRDIQSGAFYNCPELVSVELPMSATVSENIFLNNHALTRLTMAMPNPLAYYFKWHQTTPNGYKEVVHSGTSASKIYGTVPTSLREVNLLGSPCATVLKDCDMLTKITIATNATYIGASAFRNCTGLTDVSIPDSVTSIGAYAFAATSISSIVIPDEVVLTHNDQNIFEGCAQLTQVTLPRKNTCLPAYLFLNCANLKELQIPDRVTHLGAAFIAGTSILSLTVPSGLETIEKNTFSGCEKLEIVILPQTLKQIGYGAFENCVALRKIDFPDGLQQIGHNAFAGCTSLKHVMLPDSLETLDYAAFQNCTALNHVELPATLEKIARETFFGCSSLKEIDLPADVTVLSYAAFEGSGLVAVTIPEGVVAVGARLFANCTSLETVVFTSDHIPLSNEMFLGATALEELRLPASATEIPLGFCQGAASLKMIEINEGVTVIKHDAFRDCTSLRSVTLPTTLKGIWERVFKGCTSLQSVDFSNAAISEEGAKVGVEWFADCTSLTEIKNHEGLRYLNPSLFRNTPLQVTENGMTVTLGWLLEVSPEELSRVVTIPDGVTKIYDYVFSACEQIEEVILPEGVVFLGIRIFGESQGSSLVKLTLPDSLTSFSSDTICFLPNFRELVVGKGMQRLDVGTWGGITTITFRGTLEEFAQMPWSDHASVQRLTIVCTNGTVAPRE